MLVEMRASHGQCEAWEPCNEFIILFWEDYNKKSYSERYVEFHLPKWLVKVTALPATVEFYLHLAGANVMLWS